MSKANYPDRGAKQDDRERGPDDWRNWGVIEVAIRNPSVAEYMRHWEGRAISAEAERDTAIRERDELREAVGELVACWNWSIEIGNDTFPPPKYIARLELAEDAARAALDNSRPVSVQACRPEDRAMLATDAGKELLRAAASHLSAAAHEAPAE